MPILRRVTRSRSPCCSTCSRAPGGSPWKTCCRGAGWSASIASLPGSRTSRRRLVREAPAIGAAARAGERHASEAVDLFARLLASAAGNLALTALARGGVYLSGGIAPRILPFLRQPSVLAAFRDKPPMRDLLEAIPLSVVLDEQLGLIGAARAALQLVQESQ